MMPPFRGSWSGDRDCKAMAASRGDGKGTLRELHVKKVYHIYHRRTLRLYKIAYNIFLLNKLLFSKLSPIDRDNKTC